MQQEKQAKSDLSCEGSLQLSSFSNTSTFQRNLWSLGSNFFRCLKMHQALIAKIFQSSYESLDSFQSLVLSSDGMMVRFNLYLQLFLVPILAKNKFRPILVQGLLQDIEINFHIINIYGSVVQWISAWLWIWRTLVRNPVREIFLHLNFF